MVRATRPGSPMPYRLFHDLFPAIAERETLTLIVPPGSHRGRAARVGVPEVRIDPLADRAGSPEPRVEHDTPASVHPPRGSPDRAIRDLQRWGLDRVVAWTRTATRRRHGSSGSGAAGREGMLGPDRGASPCGSGHASQITTFRLPPLGARVKLASWRAASP